MKEFCGKIFLRNKKTLFLLNLAIFFAISAFSQNLTSVPLSDEVYSLLDAAQIRSLCQRLPTDKPYSKKLVCAALEEIIANRNATEAEREIAARFLDRIKPSADKKWQESGAIRREDSLKNGDCNNFSASVSAETEHKFNANERNYCGDFFLRFSLEGDLSKYFSYGINAAAGFSMPGKSACEPFSFSQKWDGYRFVPPDFHFGSDEEDFGFAIQFLPELSLSFLDGMAEFSFSRIRRDWGIADGNLMLSAEAQPFMALETHIRPAKWFNFSAILGTLEYKKGGTKWEDAAHFQNSFAAGKFEFFAGRWFYFALNSSAVFPKRFEQGYFNPANFILVYQDDIGDFDNLQFGFSLGARIPKYARFYFNFFADEINENPKTYFSVERRIFALQAGAKTALPLAFGALALQYTKLEPHMYTHYLSKVPWHSEKMNVNYMNHGESLGYHLPPNSDEIKLRLDFFPRWFLKSETTFRMARHGIDARGSSISSVCDYDEMSEKNFLKDGVYEWIYSMAFSVALNLRRFRLPFDANFSFCLFYRDLTAYESGRFKHLKEFSHEGTQYRAGWNNLFSLGIKVF